MEDNNICDKTNLIDRYDLTVIKNELELKINEIFDKLVDTIVDLEVIKKDFAQDIVRNGFEVTRLDKMILGSTRRIEEKQKKINEEIHLNIMCIDDSLDKLKKELKNKDIFITFIITLYFIFCIF